MNINIKHPDHLSESERFMVMEKLMAKKRALKRNERLVESAERGEVSGENTGDIAHIPLHDADLASDEAMRELSSQVAQIEILEIQNIEDAIKRLESGVYGFCENCEEPVAKARLLALPEARFCLECEASFEEAKRRGLKPSQENLDDGVIYKNDYSKTGFQV